MLPIAGCIQGQATVSLNSDGSGKMIIELAIDPCSSQIQGNEWGTYRTYLTQIKDSLLQSEGIDAWSQVEWKNLPNGKFYFKGMAYFNSIDEVVIHLGQTKANLKAIFLKENSHANILEMKSDKIQAVEKSWEKQNSALRYKLFSADMTEILNEFRLDLIFILPAKAEKLSGFESIDEQTIHYLFSGKKMTYLLEYIRQNSLYQLPERWNYNRMQFFNNELIPLYLDKTESLHVEFAGNSNIFDFAKEKAASKKDIIEIIDRLDGDAVKAKIEHQLAEKQIVTQKPSEPRRPEFDIETKFRNALVYESKNQYEKAISIYTNIIEANHVDVRFIAQAHYRLGLCYFETGDKEKALKQFETVILNFSNQRLPAVRSSNMIRDIRNETAIRKADKVLRGPTIIGSSPDLYVQDVNSKSVTSITIQFSQPMDPTNWFYSSFSPGKLPEVTGPPSFDSEGKSWTLPVKLEPNEVYAIGINCGDAMTKQNVSPGFRSNKGQLCKPFVLIFATMNDANEPTDIDAKLIDKSEEINIKD
jgi:tetratricopeptide (TPR) repeat protein